MSGKTKIEWATHQWNPVTGCSKVSQGCKHCYAEREWPRLAAPRAKPNIYTGRAFTDVMCHPEKLDIPLHWREPRRIFVNSMSDLFHKSVPDSFIAEVFTRMELAHHHIYQVLTKRPERMLDFLTNMDNYIREVGYPQGVAGRFPNVWLGVSVEDQATADERIPLLLDTPAAVRWISAEPLLGQIDLTDLTVSLPDGVAQWDALRCDTEPGDCAPYGTATIDWVVAGGESGSKARPMHPDWVRSLRDQCQVAGVPFFFKQWGEWAPCIGGTHWICPSGEYSTNYDYGLKYGASEIARIGKKLSGCKLDGETWDYYPDGSDEPRY